ncbi:MAG: type II toxin-antitoxin system RelE/ParE family toxin [Deinococcales bacterium]
MSYTEGLVVTEKQRLRIEWADRAREDLEEIYEQLELFSIDAADRTVQRLINVIEDLAQDATLGTPVPNPRHSHIFSFGERPYKMYYRRLEYSLEIVHIEQSTKRGTLLNKPLR